MGAIESIFKASGGEDMPQEGREYRLVSSRVPPHLVSNTPTCIRRPQSIPTAAPRVVGCGHADGGKLRRLALPCSLLVGGPALAYDSGAGAAAFRLSCGGPCACGLHLHAALDGGGRHRGRNCPQGRARGRSHAPGVAARHRRSHAGTRGHHRGPHPGPARHRGQPGRRGLHGVPLF